MKKFFIAFIILSVGGGLSHAQSDARPRKFQAGLTGSLNHVFSYGTEKDYQPGKNDFPVTPGHTAGGIGIFAAYSVSSLIAVEIETRFYLRSKMTLKDPSDQDSVDVRSASHAALAVGAVFSFSRGRFRPYAAVGAGIDALLVKAETYTSKFGYEIEFQPPSKKLDPFLKARTGVKYFLKPRLGIRGEAGYTLIFGDQNKIHSLDFAAGIFYGF